MAKRISGGLTGKGLGSKGVGDTISTRPKPLKGLKVPGVPSTTGPSKFSPFGGLNFAQRRAAKRPFANRNSSRS